MGRKHGRKSPLTQFGDSHILPPHDASGSGSHELQTRPNARLDIRESVNNPCGWVCTGEAGERAFLRTTKRPRWHGCRRYASDTRPSAAVERIVPQACASQAPESNRSRKRLLSFAPLGHGLSGGLFLRYSQQQFCCNCMAKPHALIGATRPLGHGAGASRGCGLLEFRA